MKPVNEVVACVVDHGMFIPWAEMLSRGFKKVYYHSPWESAFPKIGECTIGDGFECIERCEDPLDLVDECDLFIFPDIGFCGLQAHLKKLGKPVWGSGYGDGLEIYRENFMKILKEVGLSVPGYTVIRGLTKLKEFLKDKEDKYLKVSKYRGSFETYHYKSWREDELEFDKWSSKFGPTKEEISFVVVDPIETEIEDGYDGYCVDGKFPEKAMHGLECKDKGYICSIQDFDDLPDQVKDVNTAFSEKMKELGYRNNFSTEIRITEDDFFFIDPTCRLGSPPSQSFSEMISNWCEIVWGGAHGDLVEMEVEWEFGVQSVLKAKGDSCGWRIADIPKEIRQWVKCGNCCEIDGRLCFPPDEDMEDVIGWVVGVGDTVEEAIEHLKETCSKLPDGVHSDVQSLVKLIQEMEEAKKMGIVISDDIPDPEIVLEK